MKKTTVCILDDEPIVGDRLKPELEDDGYQVEVFTDSASALQRVEETCFDVFITDLKMEGVDGIGFLERVKEKCPGSEVIVITGFATMETARESLIKGERSYCDHGFCDHGNRQGVSDQRGVRFHRQALSDQ